MFSKESFQVYLINCLEWSTFKASHDDYIWGKTIAHVHFSIFSSPSLRKYKQCNLIKMLNLPSKNWTQILHSPWWQLFKISILRIYFALICILLFIFLPKSWLSMHQSWTKIWRQSYEGEGKPGFIFSAMQRRNTVG